MFPKPQESLPQLAGHNSHWFPTKGSVGGHGFSSGKRAPESLTHSTAPLLLAISPNINDIVAISASSCNPFPNLYGPLGIKVDEQRL